MSDAATAAIQAVCERRACDLEALEVKLERVTIQLTDARDRADAEQRRADRAEQRLAEEVARTDAALAEAERLRALAQVGHGFDGLGAGAGVQMGAPLHTTTVLVLAAVLDANGAGVWATRVPVVVHRKRDAQDAADDGPEGLRSIPGAQPALAGEVR